MAEQHNITKQNLETGLEHPGAAATATGVKVVSNEVQYRHQANTHPPQTAIKRHASTKNVSKQIPPNIKKVARSIGYAAWLDTADCWLGLVTVLQARLEPHQRASLAYACLRTIHPDHVAQIAELAMYGPEQGGDAA